MLRTAALLVVIVGAAANDKYLGAMPECEIIQGRVTVYYQSAKHTGFRCSSVGTNGKKCTCTAHPTNQEGGAKDIITDGFEGSQNGAAGVQCFAGSSCDTSPAMGADDVAPITTFGLETGIAKSWQAHTNRVDNWVSVSFQQVYKNPVVILGTPSFVGGNEVVANVANITSTGFMFHLHEDVCRDAQADGTGLDWHLNEEVAWLVGEAGEHLINNKKIVLGTHDSLDNNAWSTINLPTGAFTNAPVVLTQIQNANQDGNWHVNVRQDAHTSTSFKARSDYLQEGNSNSGLASGTEVLGYIAMEAQTDAVNNGMNFIAGLTDQVHDSSWKDIQLGHDFGAENYAFFGQVATTDTNDAESLDLVSLRFHQDHKNGNSIRVFLDDHDVCQIGKHAVTQGATTKVGGHPNEKVAYMAFRPGIIAPTPLAKGWEVGKATSDQEDHYDNQGVKWHDVTFLQTYKNPVVFAGVPSHVGPNEIVVNIKDVTATGFKWHMHETACKDQRCYRKEGAACSSTTCNPTISAAGECLQMDGGSSTCCQYLASDWHLDEEVAWMVAEAGTHEIEGKKMFVGKYHNSVVKDWTHVQLPFAFTSAQPTLLTQIQNTPNDATLYFVNLRHQNGDSDSFEVRTDYIGAVNSGVSGRAHLSGAPNGEEDIGYIVMENQDTTTTYEDFATAGTPEVTKHFQGGVTAAQYDEAPKNLAFASSFTDNSYAFFGNVWSYTGGDPVTVRFHQEAKLQDKIEINLHEEHGCEDSDPLTSTSRGSFAHHNPEQISYFASEEGILEPVPVTA
jgi:hypothetical protein